jgi:hypothetical protein
MPNDYIAKIYADADDSIDARLDRIRRAIDEANGKTRLLTMRDTIRECLTSEFQCKVAAVALTRPASRPMATPAEIASLIHDLANNIAQCLCEEVEEPASVTAPCGICGGEGQLDEEEDNGYEIRDGAIVPVHVCSACNGTGIES